MRLTKTISIDGSTTAEVRETPGGGCVVFLTGPDSTAGIGLTERAWEAVQEFVDRNRPIRDAYIRCGESRPDMPHEECVLDADHATAAPQYVIHVDRLGERWAPVGEPDPVPDALITGGTTVTSVVDRCVFGWTTGVGYKQCALRKGHETYPEWTHVSVEGWTYRPPRPAPF